MCCVCSIHLPSPPRDLQARGDIILNLQLQIGLTSNIPHTLITIRHFAAPLCARTGLLIPGYHHQQSWHQRCRELLRAIHNCISTMWVTLPWKKTPHYQQCFLHYSCIRGMYWTPTGHTSFFSQRTYLRCLQYIGRNTDTSGQAAEQ